MKKLLFLIFCAISVIFISSCGKGLIVNPDKSISLTFDTVTVVSGISVQIVSKNYSAINLIWSSSDTTIVSVSASGLVMGKKSGQATITVTTKSKSVSATCLVIVTPKITVGPISQIPGTGTDIGIGADSSVFVIGTQVTSSTGGYSISKLVGNKLVKLPDCAAIRVAVSPQGVPWVVNKSNLIYRYNGTTWDVMPGTATDIGIGADGSIFIIGTQDVSPTGGFDILKWNGSNWGILPNCAGTRIAVGPNGIPWVVNKSNIVYQNIGTELWDPVPGVSGNDIGIGADGSVYVTGADNGTSGYKPPLYKFTSGAWQAVPNAFGTSVSVSPKGKPWWTDKSNNIFKLN